MKTIVIVGGGAGGLELATQLGHKLGRKQKANIILVDKNRTHVWKPLLHEVATGTFDAHLDAVVYHAHGAKHGYQFQLGEMTNVDPQQKHITLAPLHDGDTLLSPERQLSYDYLVLAVGSQSNDFGTPGVKDRCFFLDSHHQAEQFHHALLNQFTSRNQAHSPSALTLAIVGAGATGVELSAELFHVSGLLESYGFSQFNPEQLKIKLIEAGPRILPALPERISNAARRELVNLGVEVMENTRVSSADDKGYVTAEGERIDADMMIWAAGVKAPDFLAKMGLFELNRANQILVREDLATTADADIYAIGDCCGFQNPDGSWVPPRAQSAHQMADCVKTNLIQRIQERDGRDYRYVDYGSLVNLSRFSTVGSLMGSLTKNSMFIEGHIAKFVYLSLYRMHQVAIHGRARAFLLWLSETLVKVVRPKMKLH